MDQLDLHHLRCVVAVAEELNFGRAAARLHMSQPPLSRLVSEVEREVGARLFERTTRRVTLTPVGEVFVVEARAVLAGAELALESVRAAVRRQTGKLRIAYTWLAFNTMIPQLLTRLREQDHDVSVDLVELATEAQREALASGHVDLGFVDEPIELEGFESVRLVELPLNVLLHAGHPLAAGDQVQFNALAGETLILHARHECPRHYDELLSACREAGFTPRIHHREARQNCIALVAAGQGLLLAPGIGFPHLPVGLRCLPLEAAPAQLRAEVWAVLPVAPTSPISSQIIDLREII
ncbi:MAG: LysR substrate-binding domain-containing protein, partial [Actinomycetota bacterium]